MPSSLSARVVVGHFGGGGADRTGEAERSSTSNEAERMGPGFCTLSASRFRPSARNRTFTSSEPSSAALDKRFFRPTQNCEPSATLQLSAQPRRTTLAL